MALVRDAKRTLDIARMTNWRSLILVDMPSGTIPVWCLFDHPYDASQEGSIGSQFSETYATLAAADIEDVFTVETLPILHHIGGWKSTMVIRQHGNSYRFLNGEQAADGDVMGLGG